MSQKWAALWGGGCRGWLRLSNLRCCGKLCCVPAAAQRLDELNCRSHLIHAQSYLGLLIAQQGSLRGDHIEIGIETGLVAGRGDVQVSLRRLHRRLLAG